MEHSSSVLTIRCVPVVPSTRSISHITHHITRPHSPWFHAQQRRASFVGVGGSMSVQLKHYIHTLVCVNVRYIISITCLSRYSLKIKYHMIIKSCITCHRSNVESRETHCNDESSLTRRIRAIATGCYPKTTQFPDHPTCIRKPDVHRFAARFMHD